ncbi:unnamed protein product [marine sediment metagenome]|uniref:Uncharacterized protein n=1 Tax=marine sediment metagenome TaxID=412755 RepID=X1VHC4_9ZZZZ
MINGLYSVLINGVPKIKHKDAIDVSTPHELADLVNAVCSETDASTIAAALIVAYPPSMTDEWKKFIMVYGI